MEEKTWIRYKRWIAESAFSSIKRMFGEYASSIKWNNIVNELMLKASIYNMFIDKTMIKNGNKISHNYSLKLVIRPGTTVQ